MEGESVGEEDKESGVHAALKVHRPEGVGAGRQ